MNLLDMMEKYSTHQIKPLLNYSCKNNQRKIGLICLLTIGLANTALGGSLSFQGYSGLLHTPSATSLERGQSIYQYSDKMFFSGRYRHSNNLIAAYGVLPGLEISGRMSWNKTQSNLYLSRNSGDGPRDISANAKWTLPLIPENWLSVAVGVEDLGGQASHFSRKYIVGSKNLGPVTFHAGYGNGDNRRFKSDLRLDGAFGGVEYQPFRFLTVMAEHDGGYENAGIRFSLPLDKAIKGASIELTSLFYQSNEELDNKQFYSLALNIPIGSETGAKAALKDDDYVAVTLPKQLQDIASKLNPYPSSETTPSQEKLTEDEVTPIDLSEKQLNLLISQLEKIGFENLKVGESEDQSLWIRFENNTFNRNELDGISIVAGKACTLAQASRTVVIVLENQKLPVSEMHFSPRSCQSLFLEKEQNALVPPEVFPVQDRYFKHVTWLASGKKSSFIKPRITLSPSISNGVATEYGVLDYSAGIYSNLMVNLAPGALFTTSRIDVIDETDDFIRIPAFAANRLVEGSNEWEIQQTLPFGKHVWNTFHYGRFGRFFEGYLNQVHLISSSGRHKVTYRSAKLEHAEYSHIQREPKIWSYRYYVQKFDLDIEAYYGTFWAGDEGYRIDTKFWFGDMAVGIIYRNTEAEFIGMRWTLPFAPRKEFNHLPFQIRGFESWNYSIQTRINEDINYVAFDKAIVPKWNWETDRTYFNNDRMGSAYVQRHVHRMRNFYSEYSSKHSFDDIE